MTTFQKEEEIEKRKKKVKECILRGVCIVIGITIMFVALGIHVFPESTSSNAFAGITFLISVIGFVLLIIRALSTVSHAQQRITFAISGVAAMLLLTIMAHRVTSPSAVLLCLFASLCIIFIATKIGFSLRIDSTWILPLVIITCILLAVALINAFLLRLEVLENVLALLLICILAVWTVFDASLYVNGEVCLHDCCEEGVFNIYQNFIEIAKVLFSFND